ncbi:MAG TPA: hypothetical protein VJH04_03080 [archaeon]|nr:hypothetical protein [archaeon]
MNKIDKMVSRMIDFALENPELSPSKVLVINLGKNTLEKVLTPSRMNLIRTIRESNPKSVSNLARLVKRPIEAVSRDLSILENYGIMEFVRNGKTKKPKIENDMILIPLTY